MSTRLAFEMEIKRVELGRTGQLIPIVNDGLTMAEREHRLFTQLLQHAIDVYRGQTGCIGEVCLGHRQIEAIPASAPDDAEAYREFAHQVRNPGQCTSPPNRQDRLPLNGRVEQGGKP